MLLLGTDGRAEEKTCRMCVSNRLLFVRFFFGFFLAFSLHDDSLMPESLSDLSLVVADVLPCDPHNSVPARESIASLISNLFFFFFFTA